MEHSYFWPDVNGDREYTDDDYAEYAGGFATHGVQNGDLAVTAGGNMSVVIPAGRAYVGPAWKVRKYYNDSPLTLTVANADGVLNRKDTIVLRSDINTRDVTAQVITGTPASNPVAPAIVRTAEQYDLKIAEISIPAGTTAITQALITDTRLDSTVCGIVTGVFQQIDTTTFYNQIQADLASFKSVNEADFTAWVNSLKDVLDAETAGNLLNLINNHKADYPSHITQLTCTKSGTVYALTGLTATTGIVSCIFKADTAYVAGDTFTVNGTAYAVQTSGSEALRAGAILSGDIVNINLDIANKKIYIRQDSAAQVGALSLTARIEIPANADLHNYYTPGCYSCSYNGVAATLLNCPISDAFNLDVCYATGTGTYVGATITRFTDGTKFYAFYSEGTWSAWNKSDAGKADYASNAIALTTAGLRNALIIPESITTPTGFADGTVILKYTP